MTTINFLLKGDEKKNQFNKKTKINNQKNKDQIGKNNISQFEIKR